MDKNLDIDIEVKNVSVSYGEVEALENVSFKVVSKDFIGIIGPNGGGKSTLIKALLGTVNLKKGEIKINNKKGIGYVPQFAEFDQNFPVSVHEVILMGMMRKKSLFFKKYTDDELLEVDEMMKKLYIYNLKDKQIGELSGGELQKTLVARAMVSNPGILLLDEPTASLDVKIKNEIYEMLKKLSEEVTILIITHDIAEIFSYVNSVIYVNKTLHYHGRDSKMKKHVVESIKCCPIEEFVIKEEALKKEFMNQGVEVDDKCND